LPTNCATIVSTIWATILPAHKPTNDAANVNSNWTTIYAANHATIVSPDISTEF
jgi:hypothetical protein